MKIKSFTVRFSAILIAWVGVLLLASAHSQAQTPPVEAKLFSGAFNLSTNPATFTFAGVAPDMGRFIGFGEVELSAGAEPGKQIVSGPVVLRAPNGDLLVGNLSGDITEQGRRGPVGAHLQFHWVDTVRLRSGIVVNNTGRFLTRRPAGIVVKDDDPRTPQTNIIIRILIIILR